MSSSGNITNSDGDDAAAGEEEAAAAAAASTSKQVFQVEPMVVGKLGSALAVGNYLLSRLLRELIEVLRKLLLRNAHGLDSCANR